LFFIACLGGMTCRRKSGPGPELGPPRWASQAIGYQIFVRSFYDSDSDGTGDLTGVAKKLDYLNDGEPGGGDLEVNLIWLTPIHPSPSYHGYDVTDYRAVNPQLGSLEDFCALVEKARARGVRIVLDLVVNHTSSQHPWFIASASSPRDPRRDWYIWRDEDPGWKQPWGSRSPVWHRRGEHYYYGLFWEGMPDLNLENQAVLDEVSGVIEFWLDQGVSGFRIDAARHLVEDPEGCLGDTARTHQVARRLKRAMRSKQPETLLLAEAWTKTETVAAYAGEGDEYDLAFNFDLAAVMATALLAEDPGGIEPVLQRAESAFERRGFDAPFFENHDMDRLRTRLGGQAEPLKVAAALLLTLPGTPFLYYGQEIGMANATGCRGDSCRRAPMDWDRVEAQQGEPGSLLSLYRRLIHIRRCNPALTSPRRLRLPTDAAEVYAVLRGSGEKPVLVVLNFSPEPRRAGVDLSAIGATGASRSASELLSGRAVTLPAAKPGYYSLPDLPPWGVSILSL
jgi:alpha-amylase